MTRLLVLAAVPALMLASCERPDTPAPTEPPAQAVELGGVNLGEPVRVLGTEPFWAVNITPDALTYSDPEGEGPSFVNAGPSIQGTTATWRASAEDGTSLELVLVDTACSDGMSDRTYPLSARLTLGEQTLNGCAASVDFLMNTDEQGNRVQQ